MSDACEGPRPERASAPEPPRFGPTRFVRLGDGTDQAVPVPLCNNDDQLMFESEALRIGIFDVHPKHPKFRFSGVPGEHIMVFPHRSVLLQRLGEEPYVCDPMVVHFLNPEQIYFRRELHPHGDRAVWMAFDARLLHRLLSEGGDLARTDLERLWPREFCPSDSWSYLAQAELAAQLAAGTVGDPSLVEAVALELLRRAIRNSREFEQRLPAATPGRNEERRRCIVDRTRELLTLEYANPLSLAQIARRVEASASTLSRRFRWAMAMPVHQYRLRLRLRIALLELYQESADLSDLALRSGFSSHSHFTGAFHDKFGVTPSWVAKAPDEDRLRTLLRTAREVAPS